MSEYLRLACTPSDINEHMPTLKRYAELCSHVTELGVRNVVSVWAWLEAGVSTIRAYDFAPPDPYRLREAETAAANNNIDFKFFLDDVLKIELEPTELLFIDTWHVYEQVKQELALHANKVSKYIIFHDTTTFGQRGEGGQHVGLNPAINEFLLENDHWIIKEIFTNNNGLTILERI